MASVLRKPDKSCVAIVDSFDCPCGGRAVVKAFHFNNVWKKAAEDGAVHSAVRRYYAHCLTCGDVSDWRFSCQEARSDLLEGRTIMGFFDGKGKYHLKHSKQNEMEEN